MNDRLHATTTVMPPARTVPWRHAGLLMAITFSGLQMLNEIGVMMAIPLYTSMSTDLGLTPAQVSWALLATTLCGAASIALLAKAGDLFGHRRLMVLCLVGITVGYAISALAPSFTLLIVGRALTGIMAGQALCIGIMNDRLRALDRKKAIAIIAGGQAVGVFFGFGLGGVMISIGATWRTAFWIGGALTVISLVGFLLWGSDSDAKLRVVGTRRRLDIGGVLLMGLGLTALCVGITQSAVWGFTSTSTLLFVGVGLALLALSLAWEARAEDPLLDIRQLFSRRLAPAYAVFLTMGVAGMLMFNFVMGWAQTPEQLAGYGFGLTPLMAGLLFIPMTVAGLVAARVVPPVLVRVSPSRTIIGAALLMMATFLWLYAMHDQVWAVVTGILFYGFAYTTLFTTAVSVIASEAVAGKGAGTASIYVAMALSGSSVGTAVYAAIVGANADPATMLPTAQAYDIGFLTAAAACLVALGGGLTLSREVRLSEVSAH